MWCRAAVRARHCFNSISLNVFTPSTAFALPHAPGPDLDENETRKIKNKTTIIAAWNWKLSFRVRIRKKMSAHERIRATFSFCFHRHKLTYKLIYLVAFLKPWKVCQIDSRRSWHLRRPNEQWTVTTNRKPEPNAQIRTNTYTIFIYMHFKTYQKTWQTTIRQKKCCEPLTNTRFQSVRKFQFVNMNCVFFILLQIYIKYRYSEAPRGFRV